MHPRLDGLTALITGASGGIGRAVADAFGHHDTRLALLARSRQGELSEWIATRPWHASAMSLSVDLRDVAAVDRAFEDVRESFGRVDVCIVNAGIWPTATTPLAELDPARIREVVEVNLLGAMFTARAFLRSLAVAGPRSDGRGASLCFIGSTAGRFGEAGHCDYAATKAALVGLMRSIKNEIVSLDPYARVNMVEPGWTATPMAAEAIADDVMITHATATMSLRQLARAEDIAHAVTFLSAPGLARHISGEVLTVAGGMEGRLLWSPSDVQVSDVRQRLETE